MPRLSEDKPFLHPDVDLTDVTLGRYTEIGKGSRIAYSEFMDYAYCDRYADVANATIGKFANIASFVRIGATDHPLETAALHHFLYRSAVYWDDATDDPAFFAIRRARRAAIGHDTWIGHNAQIKPGITVGDGAVVASGAIVTKDVAPYTIVAGTPAKVLRLRQPAAIAERLIALAWWDWDHARLRRALEDFRAMPAEAFLEKYEG
ncbi:chloramphenicol acetyltransferase [Pseudooceanicola sediminis]|uniref:Chloramphenicol acetyltransferase n=1 Tax=Pseudooceanicola sediminis TaxID=2211117 RepID=A0A399J2D2_9RHOB|nr:DapH/DapD/GlmU-related protein [Pseudooceanicola sediminis]KAA2312043.1 chloramphenicol acetyltransferase [Puniceibacterium sp. HSS470]RII38052.1 chloramphenicol acetyltransferase [Pseudooceanicola sediminis]|tara:strand:+ start:40009 stop:40626 length:618 start_codon:yes stop_codon:yes gene_type:complete